MGVKGVLPACCLPHWGREGVILVSVRAEPTRKFFFLKNIPSRNYDGG